MEIHSVTVVCLLFSMIIHLYHCSELYTIDFQEDKKMSGQFFVDFSMSDASSCSILCQQITRCASISYDTENKICELNEENSVDGTLTTSTGYLFADITSSAVFVSGCSTRPCGDYDFCLLDGNGGVRGCATTFTNTTM